MTGARVAVVGIHGHGASHVRNVARLAEAGRSLCILERGKRWDKTEFPRSTGEVAKSFWVQNESLGFLEYNAFRRIDVIRGSGVGGGSLHYFNVHLRAPKEIFAQRVWPGQVTRAALRQNPSSAQSCYHERPSAHRAEGRTRGREHRPTTARDRSGDQG